jgi:FtsH-binding integral membrane protein
MKKAIMLLAALGGSLAVYAQDKPEPLINRDFIFDLIHIAAVLLIIYLISSFFLQLVRSNFDFRLKSKILDRQTDENIVGQLVRADKANPFNSVLQWICTLAAVGVGFMLIEFTQPFGLHSLAIMAICVAAGLGVYYFVAKQTKK